MTDELQRAVLEKHAEVLRGLIRYENDITNQRTTWLLVSQGILFAAGAAFQKEHWVPAVVIALVGIVMAVSIGQALQNSFEARMYLKRSWRERLQQGGFKWEDFPPLDGGVPGVAVERWLFPWRVMPRLFILAWGVLAVYFYVRAT